MRYALVVGIALVIVTACASTSKPLRNPRQMSGLELYQQLCSSCHGVGADGNGPVASLIKIERAVVDSMIDRLVGHLRSIQVE